MAVKREFIPKYNYIFVKIQLMKLLYAKDVGCIV